MMIAARTSAQLEISTPAIDVFWLNHSMWLYRTIRGDTGRSDRHLEFLGGAKGNLFARLDVDLLAGRRIAAYAGGTLAHLQDAKPCDLHLLAFLQVLGD